MIINRHNYEECFILYWDNELSLSQKQAVENFVKENLDLQEEFNLLGQTRFIPDNNIELEKKEFLLNDSFINITNYEEQLLNYIDDEVTADQRKEIESFAGQYSAVKQELSLLQKTKLQPEAEVVFPDKSILYRREENADSYRHRVISMTWFRVAVAAAVLLIAGFATIKLINKNEVIPTVARIDESKNQPVVKTTDQSTNNSVDQTPQETKNHLASTDKKSTKEQPKVKEVKKKDDETVVPNNFIAKRENRNNLPDEGIKNNQHNQPNNAEEVIVYNISKGNYKAEKSQSSEVNNPLDNSSVTKSSFASLDNIVIDDIREKGGLKEFLRKTTRVFERRTKIQTTTDDNKLLLGAFAVSLK